MLALAVVAVVSLAFRLGRGSRVQLTNDLGAVGRPIQPWFRSETIEMGSEICHGSSRDQVIRWYIRCYVLMVSSAETILEQQRRLLTSIQTIEGLALRGHFGECLRLIENFESDLGSAMDAPILPHLRSRLALLHDRIRILAETAAKASDSRSEVDAESDPSVRYRARWGGVVPWSTAEASAAADPKVDAECDPLVGYRDTLGKAVPAPDLSGPVVSVPDTTQIWWRCSMNPEHQPWKATKAQTARGRPCPMCLAEAGLTPNAWYPTDTRPGRFWLDAHNHAFLSNLRNQ